MIRPLKNKIKTYKGCMTSPPPQTLFVDSNEGFS